MARIHVCLVSYQPIPNLIPLKTEGLRPEKVINLVSPDMQVQAARLKKIANDWGITVEEKPIEPYDLDSARETCLDLLAHHEDDDLTLNVTGGTKIMALAAFEVFREFKKEIIYVDTQNETIQILSPNAATVTFRNVIRVRPYLAAYGQNIIEDRTNHEMVHHNRNTIDGFLRDLGKYELPISILNGYTAPHRNTRTFPLQVALDERHREMPDFMELLRLLEERRIVSLQGGRIVFPEFSAIEFLSGGWLEEHVFDVVSSMSDTNSKMGIVVEWSQSGRKPTTNEYDVVFTHNNRLYLIECKTKRFVGRDQQGVNEDLIYKLESLRNSAGGLYGKGMLVSYRRLTDKQKKRLKTNRLEFCDREELRDLKAKIGRWITS
jgi:hypothetical protein